MVRLRQWQARTSDSNAGADAPWRALAAGNGGASHGAGASRFPGSSSLPGIKRGFTTRILLLGLLSAVVGAFTPGCRHVVPLTPYTAYVVNHGSATLAAVNLADFHVTGSLAVAPGPDRVLMRPGARQLYVVSGMGRISVAAFPPLRLLATLEVGKSARDLAFSPDGRAAYVLDPADHEVVFLDCAGDVPRVTFRLRLEGTLAGLALSPDGKTLVADSDSLNQLVFISTETRQTLGTVGVGKSPGPMVILPDNSKVFVADTGENKISVADLATRRLYSHLEIGNQPTALLVKPDGGEIFVLAAPSSTMVIMDAFHDNVEQTFPLGKNPVAGVFKPDMSALFIANAGDGSVLAMDPQNRQALASTPVGIEPRALALTPDGRLLVVADRAGSSLAIMRADATNLSSNRSALITTVPVGDAPVDVIVPDDIRPESGGKSGAAPRQ